ncbi:MAG: hypothetical protein ABL999_16380 [Pyrinomonadaceae bacterium]
MERRVFRYWWAGFISLAFGIALVFLVVWIGHFSYKEQLRIANSTFKVRILKKPTLLLNYSYLFQSSPVAHENWKDIYEFTSDPQSVNDLAALVNETTGYVRSNRVFLVTTDSGLRWKAFDLADLASIPDESSSCTWIGSVKLDVDGTGSMKLRGCIKHRPLATNNYGVAWE